MSTGSNLQRRNIGWLAGVVLVFFFLLGPGYSSASEVVVNTSVLNVRSGPGPQHSLVGQAKMGDCLTTLEQRGDWYKVRLAGGSTGWVASWLVNIKKEDPAASSTSQVVIKTGTLNVRGGPGIGNEIVGSVYKGDKLKVLSSSGDWYQVVLSDGRAGWVAGWLVDVEKANTPEPGSGQTSENSASFSKEAVVKGSVLNVRGGPGTSNAVVGQVSQGDRLPIVESSNGWCKVELPGGGTGWVAGWLVDVKVVSEPKTQPVTGEAVVYASSVNVRGGPGTNHQVITSVSRGERMSIMEKAGEWYKVQLSRGAVGWIAGSLVQVESASASMPEKDQGQSQTPEGERDIPESSGQSPADQLEMYIPEAGNLLLGKVIAIDPGHGGSEPGAIGVTGLLEKDVNLDIALLTADLLRQNGARVVLTRSNDTYVSLEERPAIAARSGADLFISIHNNANPISSKSGTSTYYRRDGGSGTGVSQADNKLLAEQIQSELLRSLGRNNLGVQQANFVVLRAATMPAVLLEISFMTNAEEEQLLKQDSYKAKAAEAITRGISNYFAHKQ